MGVQPYSSLDANRRVIRFESDCLFRERSEWQCDRGDFLCGRGEVPGAAS